MAAAIISQVRIKCSQKDLSEHLGFVVRAVPSRPEPPVLGNVLLVADHESGVVSLTGFDGSLGIKTSFKASIKESGAVCLPAKLFNDIVSRLPSEDIFLSWGSKDGTEEKLVSLKSSSGNFKLNGMNPEEFPELPTVEGEEITLSLQSLTEGLSACLFAVSTEISKQILTGVCLFSSGSVLEFAATDSHRLVVVKVEEPIPEFALTIPAKALEELQKIIKEEKEQDTLKMRYDETQIVFELGSCSLNTMRLMGVYPSYERLIPVTFECSLTCDRLSLLGALGLVGVFNKQNPVVKLQATEGQLTVSIDAADVGNATQTLGATLAGKEIEIYFNLKYLMEGLRVFKSKEIKISANQPNLPVILAPFEEKQKMIYLIMPVQASTTQR